MISNNKIPHFKKALICQKGSTLIIVLIILSILALVAATLSFTSRLETISSANFAEGLQARMAAATGIQVASALLPSGIPYTSFTQPWASRNTSLRGTFQEIEGSLADFYIEDESSKLNINAADEDLLTSVFASILKTHNMDSSLAPQLAQEVVFYRLGPDQKPGAAGKDDDGDSAESSLLDDGLDNDRDGLVDNPEEILVSVKHDGVDNNQKGTIDSYLDSIEFDGLDNDKDGIVDEKTEGIDEPDEFIPDVSQTPNGDDTPFLSVDELRLLPSMTPEVFDVLRPYLTVYSASEPVCSIEGYSVQMVDINSASTQEILDILLRRFPDKDINLLKQFAVNIVDARDADSIPTQLKDSSIDTPFLGIEKTPYINEVWPDSMTADDEGDDGQYIELYNPYDEPCNVEGWKIEIAGTSVILNGIINPGGFLIITDDYDNQNDPEADVDQEGLGSFYDIFDIVKGGNSKRIIEKREIEIPNEGAVISLRDREGNLIDYFAYQKGAFTGIKRSFQREDPRVRCACWEFCSPLQKNFSYLKTESQGIQNAPFITRDRLFESPLDLLDVFAGYSNNPISDKTTQPARTGMTWSIPLMQSDGKDVLDLHMVDLFRVNSRTRLNPAGIVKILGSVDEEDLYRLGKKQKQIELSYGLININTAPVEILEALPGFGKTLAKHVEQYRNKVEKAAFSGQDADIQAVPFKGFSDLIDFILEIPSKEQNLQEKTQSRDEILSDLGELWPYITVQSRSFTIYSENRFHFPSKPAKGSSKEVRHPARSVVKTLVLVDPQGSLRIIDWGYLTQ